MAAFGEHAAHLGESFVEVSEVAYAECSRDGLEAVVRVGEVCAVLPFEGYLPFQPHLCHLFPAYVHHALADVTCPDGCCWKDGCCLNGKVARSCCNIE